MEKTRKTRKLMALLLAVTLAVIPLAGCGGGTGNSSSSAQTVGDTQSNDGRKVVKVGISGAVDTLNPLTVFTTGTWATLPAYYERLANYSQDLSELTPQMAKGWTQVDEYTYDVEIYDYITDWNGNNITADDVVFCYQYAKDGGVVVGLDALESVEKVDDYTIRFVLNSTTIMSAENVFASVDIVSQKEYEASPDQMATKCVGTGRYIVKEFVPSSSMTLVKNENYWQTEELTHYRSSGEADEIQILTILEDAQMAVALETGSIDVAKLNTGGERFKGDPNYDVFSTASTAYYYLRFNVGTDSVFYKNQALRQAISYAINVDDIVTGAYRGDGVKMHALGLPGQPGYQEKWDDEEFYEYDLDKAKELMAEAGYPNGGLEVNLLILNNDICKGWSTIVQAQLAQIGITVTVEALDSAVWYSKCISGDFDICGFNVNRPHIADNYAASVGCAAYHTDSKTNPYLAEILEDEKMQELFQEATEVETSSGETIDAAHQYVREMAYVYPLVYPINYIFARKDLNLKEPGYAQNYVLVPNTFKYND